MRAHFILFVRDQARSRAFYARVLERAPRLDVPGMTELELGPGAVLGLMPEVSITRLLEGRVEPGAARGVARAELYLHVDDVAAWHTRALAAGATELSPPAPRSWGHEASYVADPDGHVVAFARALEAE
jgi:catechol 2,3-dioxygenase-like lactoylglutathione lyase family enzyme